MTTGRINQGADATEAESLHLLRALEQQPRGVRREVPKVPLASSVACEPRPEGSRRSSGGAGRGENLSRLRQM